MSPAALRLRGVGPDRNTLVIPDTIQRSKGPWRFLNIIIHGAPTCPPKPHIPHAILVDPDGAGAMDESRCRADIVRVLNWRRAG